MDIRIKAAELAISSDVSGSIEDIIEDARKWEAYLREPAAQSGEVPLPRERWSNTPIEKGRYDLWPIVAGGGFVGDTDHDAEAGHGI